MTHNEKIDAIQQLVGECRNFATFIEHVAEFCSTEADNEHDAELGRDPLQEEIWNRRAGYLCLMSAKIEESFA